MHIEYNHTYSADIADNADIIDVVYIVSYLTYIYVHSQHTYTDTAYIADTTNRANSYMHCQHTHKDTAYIAYAD